MAMKGTALLAYGHYRSPAARHLSDVDLLVRPRDVPAAVAALRAAGLAPPSGALPALDGRSDALGRNPGDAHLKPVETWSGGLLELHDRLPGGGPPADALIAAAVEVRWSGQRVDVPALVDLAGMLCRHALVAHAEEPRLRARHVANLAALAPAGVEWAAVGRRYGRAVVRESLALLEAARAEAEAGTPAPAHLALLAPVGATYRARARWRRLLSPSAPSLPALARALFPAPGYMRARYGLPADAPWSAIWHLYPRRLLSGAFRFLAGR
ncbi:MAG: nucleotidyltransferase family protein [Anaeromyxobacter sp.]